MAARRSYGSGNLYARTDSAGAETWYGRWWSDGRQVKRRIGDKRTPGASDGLTKREAEAKLRELMATVTAAEVAALKRRGPTLAEIGEAYIVSRDLKDSTAQDYRMQLRVHLVPWFGEQSLHRITPERIDALIAHLLGQGLKVKTVRSNITTLSMCLKYAMRKGWIKSNPVNAVDLPHHRHTGEEDPLRFLRVFEVHDLANAAVPGPLRQLDRTLYLTAALTGLRQGELRGLRWEDVDAVNARLHVVQNIVRSRVTSPKSRKVRSVPLAAIVADELQALAEQSEWSAPADPVFAHPRTGNPMARTRLMERYRRALEGAGLDPAFRFHDLRHTFGTAMAAAGEPVTNIQAWMGHSDLATTRRYMHYAPAVDEAARIDRAFAVADPRGPVRGHVMTAQDVREAA